MVFLHPVSFTESPLWSPLRNRVLTKEELSGKVPIPEVYEVAARLIETKYYWMSCPSIAVVASRLGLPGTVCDIYVSQYKRAFKTWPFWGGTWEGSRGKRNRKLRRQALLAMAEICRTPI